jgi:hypothetical protein
MEEGKDMDDNLKGEARFNTRRLSSFKSAPPPPRPKLGCPKLTVPAAPDGRRPTCLSRAETAPLTRPRVLVALGVFATTALQRHPEFVLSELPADLAGTLQEYDVDNSGTVSVTELVAGAQLMRQQAKKVRQRDSRAV